MTIDEMEIQEEINKDIENRLKKIEGRKMKYEIRLKREVWNTLLHILIGAVIAYVIVPTYSFMIITCAMLGVGVLRELLQFLRKKKQPLYIHIIDAAGFVLGGWLWYGVRNFFNINADVL